MQQGMGRYQADTRQEIIDDAVHEDNSVQYVRVETAVQPPPKVPSDNGRLPTVQRPRRRKRQNIKYTDDEYDLSTVSATNQKKVILSGMLVKRGRMKSRKRIDRYESRRGLQH